MNDTIFALATGAARAAIAVIRVSGPRAHAVAARFAGRVPKPRVATLARLRDPASGELLDEALVLLFEAARSEVGEDGVEFHCHGGPAVVAAVLAALGREPGLRPAEPDEFARRAFANGRLDLAQLEGLADLIDAETQWQRRQAQRQLSGAMRDVTAPWRAALIAAAALAETAIDFSEDVELGEALPAQVGGLTEPVQAGLRAELAHGRAAERVREGVQVVIAGPPNAGKSTLLNALARREAAIVSAIAGTTRDPIEVHLDLAGCPVTLVDTAGLRDSGDMVERIGVSRARERADAADLVLWLGDVSPPPFAAPVWRIAAKSDLLGGEVPSAARGRRWPDEVGSDEGADKAATPTVAPFSETSSFDPAPQSPLLSRAGEREFRLSAVTGDNMDVLVERLTSFATELARGGAGLLARARHREAFAAALGALDAAAATPAPPVEILAEHFRAARFALERLIGTVDVEDILGDVFSRFCIGK